MLNLMASMVLSFLPQRWRRGWGEAYEVDLVRGALVSGALQVVGCGVTFCFRYIFFLDRKVQELAAQLIAHGAEEAMSAASVQFGAGFVTLMEYMIHPVSLLLLYFLIEGLVRFSAALITGEVVGTMPLHLVAWARAEVSKRAAERALGPLVVDEVQAGEGHDCVLRVLSCRPKPGWNHLMTVSYGEVLYEITGEQQGAPPRRYVYLLRLKPEHKVVRGLHQYDPAEVLKK